MAMIDYGAIAFKNGKLISTDMFTPMEETCGFSDKDNYPLPGSVHVDAIQAAVEDWSPLDGYCFVVVGNEEFRVGFYKTLLRWYHDHGEDAGEYRYNIGVEYFGSSDYRKWREWSKTFILDGMNFVDVVVRPKNGYYVARFKINDDKYKVYFGYGVDYGFYKKTRRVNYYRSPEYLIRALPHKIRWKFKDFRIWIRSIPRIGGSSRP